MNERKMIRSGYRWDVFASFTCNSTGVRVGTRKTRRGAERLAERFSKANRGLGCEDTHVKLRHDPLLDDVMNAKRSRR